MGTTSLRLGLISLALAAATSSLATSASAGTITLVGVDSGAFSTATGVTEFNPQTNTFTFTLTNTSAITRPGSTSTITGIGFDLPPPGNASASGLNGFTGQQAPSLSSNFTFSDADVGSVPHGFNSVVLDFAFLTGSSGNFSGGSVNDGLLPGESASFTVSGAAFAGFTEALIEAAMFLRFQNVPIAGGSAGSDVAVPGRLPPDRVPEPGTFMLLGFGLVGLGLSAARRRRAN